MRLSHFYYTVLKDGDNVGLRGAQAPEGRTLASAMETESGFPYTVYLGDRHLPYKQHHSLLLSNSKVKMADSEGQTIISTLKDAWQRYLSGVY
jgi:hypothetical protein